MKHIQSIDDIKPSDKGSVLVIGNFDGVHLGHVALLREGRETADELGVGLSVLTFEPHPRSLFRPDDPPSRITNAAMKAWRLEASGVDILFSLTFDWDFASQSADNFIELILKEAIAAKHVIVGYDFKFGQLRKGTPEDIKASGIDTTIIDKVSDHSAQKYSSSAVRSLLRKGNIDAANDILGWEWEMRGVIQKGDQRGREIGYPTANMVMGDMVHPAYGVYATLIQIEGHETWHKAATNIGIRPMFEVQEAQVESYIFDFDEVIYGKQVRVRPVERLRGEAKFDSIEKLVDQMDKDCQLAKEILEAKKVHQ